MKSKIVKWVFSLMAATLALFAGINAASACLWTWYQPEMPEALREE